jgi:hypothetical protein
LILVALATLGAAVVAFVLYPVFASTGANEAGAIPAGGRELEELLEKKARLYEAITDLDFEKDAGKVSEQDYQTARNDYMGQVAEILTRVDALDTRKPEKKKPRKESPAARCASCREPIAPGAKFCMHCGARVASVCAGCGEELPPEARFCPGCGKQSS